jgi:DNA-binding NtrC family response regulator
MMDGANDYLTKPCDPARISQSVEQFTSGAAAQTEEKGEILDSYM